MAPTVRTHREVVRWIAIQTAFAACLVVPSTFAIGWFLCGGDLAMTLRIVAAALVETAVFTPIVAIRSIGTLRQLNLARDELDRLANTDPLTGLWNRRGFQKEAERRAAARGPGGGPAAILICDLDFFKRVNDEFGHEFGDAALRHTADVLRSEAGADDVVLGRFGGEEFVVLLVARNHAEVAAFAERLRARMAASTVAWNGLTARVCMSIGFAAAAGVGGDLSALIARADRGLYEAKRAGRNRVREGALGPELIVISEQKMAG